MKPQPIKLTKRQRDDLSSLAAFAHTTMRCGAGGELVSKQQARILRGIQIAHDLAKPTQEPTQ